MHDHGDEPATATAARLQRHYRMPVWLGTSTGSWWALVNDRLVEADSPRALGQAIDRTLSAI